SILQGELNFYLNITSGNLDSEAFSLARKGDIVLAYSTSDGSIFSTLEIITPYINAFDAGNSSENAGQIGLKLLEIINPPILFSFFENKISFADKLEPANSQQLFPLSEDVFKNILSRPLENDNLNTIQNSTAETTSPFHFNKSSLSEIFTDSPSADIKDELDFESDVNALASVIAYKEVKPPLAIGLFGNWGSGKSFFMNKLQNRIKDLSQSRQKSFCKEVVQINFNSWHYSDSNLWASLITKIFDGLEKYGKEDSKKLEKLFENLNSTQELLKDTEQQKKKVEQEIAYLSERQQNLNDEIRKDAEDLNNLGIYDIAKEVLRDNIVAKDLDKLRADYSFLDLKEYKQINHNIDTLSTGGGRFIKSVRLIYSFRVGKLWKALTIALLTGVCVYFLTRYIGFIKEKLVGFQIFIITMAALLSQLIAYIRPALNTIKEAYMRLRSLRETCKIVETREQNKYNAQREELKNSLEGAQNSQNELRQKIEELKSKRNQLQLEIDEISSGRKIVRFIESRVTDE
ncbi:MAG: P-loop NTPase fold protein, partial [Ferruginibacter sp.]